MGKRFDEGRNLSRESGLVEAVMGVRLMRSSPGVAGASINSGLEMEKGR